MKNISFILIILMVLLNFGLAMAQSNTMENKKSQKSEATFVQGEVLVKFKPKTPKRFILALKKSLKVKEETYTSSIELYRWKGDFDTLEAIAKLKKSPHVLYAEPNFKVEIQNKP